MSMWKRLKRVVKSQANAALSQLESPEAELDLLEEELEQEKKRGKIRLADALVELKRLEKAVEKAKEEAQEWEHRAMRAVELGDDELAKEALAKKLHCDQLLEEEQQALKEQQQGLEELKRSQKRLEEQVDAAQRKRAVLQAKIKGAKTKDNIGQALSTLEPDNPLAEFERMVHKIETMEAQVEVNKELHNELAAEDMERKLRELEQRTPPRSDTDPLAALKAKMKK